MERSRGQEPEAVGHTSFMVRKQSYDKHMSFLFRLKVSVGLPISVNLMQKTPHRCAQRFDSLCDSRSCQVDIPGSQEDAVSTY